MGSWPSLPGANGSGKSSVYRALRLLADAAQNAVIASLAREGGLASPFWAGPDEEPIVLNQRLPDTGSMLASIADPMRAPEMLAVREAVRGWRFYDHFRTDAEAPARATQIGTFTPVLDQDGSNLAAALQTIMETQADEALPTTVEDAFPKSRLFVADRNGRFELRLQQHGLLRPLSAAQLSDGTLRFLPWAGALLTPRPPELMVLNESETSLHPDLLPAPARLILAAARHTQIIVVSHAQTLITQLAADPFCRRLHRKKEFGETVLESATLLSTPKWVWPTR